MHRIENFMKFFVGDVENRRTFAASVQSPTLNFKVGVSRLRTADFFRQNSQNFTLILRKIAPQNAKNMIFNALQRFYSLLWEQGVAGSNPATPTTAKVSVIAGFFFYNKDFFSLLPEFQSKK